MGNEFVLDGKMILREDLKRKVRKSRRIYKGNSVKSYIRIKNDIMSKSQPRQ